MATTIYDAEMQYLLVEQARNVGLDAAGRVAPCDRNLKSKEGHDLTPLLVYSIVVPAFRCQTRLLVSAAAPISVSLFLAQAWGLRRALGMPLRLEMKPGLLASDRGFVQWAKSLGVQCEPVQHTKDPAALCGPVQPPVAAVSAQEQYADAGDERVVSDTPASVSQATI